jgi:predicted GNAT family acetyltransferase
MDITVLGNAAQNRYEAITPDGEVAGFSAYYQRGDVIIFTHTEVDPAYEGQGIASAIAQAALDDVRGQGFAVVPLCPFIKDFIEKNPEYADLVRAEPRPE